MSNRIEIGDVGGPSGITKEQFRAQLKASDPTQVLEIVIDSMGGSVFDGFAMYDDLLQYEGTTKAIVQSAAFSIAAFIAMACDEIEITPNGYLMIHNPMADTHAGDDAEHESRAALLKKLKESYAKAIAKRSGKSMAQVQEWMAAETYFSADEAKSLGLVNRVLEAKRPSALVASGCAETLPRFVFAALRATEKKPIEPEGREMSEKIAATVQEIEAACPRAKADFVLRCVKRGLPIAQVTAEYTEDQAKAMEELAQENEELKARIAAMEEEEAARAKAQEEEEEAAKARAMEEEEEAKARARVRPGVQPVARVTQTTGGTGPTATVRWKSEIQRFIDSGNSRAKAVQLANRHNPGLREQYLAEVNG